MQFNCQSCQAKYQIADEKVAGKTVRMKCRKCGALIEVRAQRTESGLVAVNVHGDSAGPPHSQAAPSAAAPGGPTAAAQAAATAQPGTSAVHAPPARPPGPPPPRQDAPRRPGAMAPPRAGTGAPSAALAPRGGPGPVGAAPARTPSGIKPFGPSSPLRSSTLSGPAPGSAAAHAAVPLTHGFDDDEATVIMQRPSFEPEEPAPHGRPSPAAGRRAPGPAAGMPAKPLGPAATAEVPHRPGAPAAADARPPSSKIPLTPAPAPSPPPAPAPEEWYVGLGGEPVGPRPIAFLVEKLEAGEINGNSLVWKEEFADWKPLKTIPLLAALMPDEAPAAPPSTARVEAAAAGTAGARITGRGPAVAVPPAAVSHPVALTRIKDDGEPFGEAPGEPRSGAAAATAARGPAAFAPGPRSTDAPALARPAALQGVDELLLEEEQGEHRHERRKKRRGMKPIAWAFVAMAGGFGAVAAYVVFSSPPSVQPPSASAASAIAGTPASAGTSVAQSSGSAGPVGSTIVLEAVSVRPEVDSSGRPVGTGALPASTGPSAGTADIDTSGFNTGGPAGPVATTPGGPGSQAKGELTQAEISAVVNRSKGGVSRKCMPIVEAGSPSGATSARVVAHIMIGASGNVESASANGGGEFPGLADCVASRVRSWKFPASSGSTPVDVPFHFIAQ